MWCPQKDSNLPVRVRSAKSSSRGPAQHMERGSPLVFQRPDNEAQPAVALGDRRGPPTRCRNFSALRRTAFARIQSEGWRPWLESNQQPSVLETEAAPPPHGLRSGDESRTRLPRFTAACLIRSATPNTLEPHHTPPRQAERAAARGHRLERAAFTRLQDARAVTRTPTPHWRSRRDSNSPDPDRQSGA